jgi:type II secretory pathway pseudopilin PulG
MLTVISIFAVLMGLLLPALSGVKRHSQKTKELNAIRQVGLAWNIYANSNNDAALPGFIRGDVLTAWNAVYEFLNGDRIPQELAAPWPWRLLPLLDFNHEMVHGYADEPDFDLLSMSDPDEAIEIAYEPSFGYNAMYVGGWWEIVQIGGTDVPRYRYYDATADLNGDGSIGADERARVVVRSVSQIKRPSELVVFCSSGVRIPDIYEKAPATLGGSHWVVPPLLASEMQWRIPPAYQTELVIEVLNGDNPTPIGRYNGNAAVFYADGHIDAVAPGRLADQRSFIDIADRVDFQHQ